MPLKPGSSRKVISENIDELTHHGSRPRSHEQIVAIALHNADKYRRANGGIVSRDGGGNIPVNMVPGALLDPMQRQMRQAYSQIPTEKLQEMAVQYGNSPRGQMANRLLMARRMGQDRQAQPPQQQQQQDQTPGLEVMPPTQGVKRGGIVHRDMGGGMSLSMADPWWTRSEERGSESGFLHGRTPGRADKLTTTAPSGAYIIPADVIAGLGEGNSLAGANVMDKILESGPWGIRMDRSRSRGPSEARAPMPRQSNAPQMDFTKDETDGVYRDGGSIHRRAGGGASGDVGASSMSGGSPGGMTGQNWGNLGIQGAGSVLPFGGGIGLGVAKGIYNDVTHGGDQANTNQEHWWNPTGTTFGERAYNAARNFLSDRFSSGAPPAGPNDQQMAESSGFKTQQGKGSMGLGHDLNPFNSDVSGTGNSLAQSQTSGSGVQPFTGTPATAPTTAANFDSSGWNQNATTEGQTGNSASPGGGSGAGLYTGMALQSNGGWDSGGGAMNTGMGNESGTSFIGGLGGSSDFSVSGGFTGDLGGLSGMMSDLGAQQVNKGARGGGIDKYKAGGVGTAPDHGRVPVALSHGEYQVDPEDVARIGRGNMKLGHAILDQWVQEARKRHIEKLKKLKPPVGAKAA
ncbi:MAG TPA: hypothetical protein VMU19_15745 [Bryobacteraceae bacterium]|nr:hypothetical protein [Bryobacteraceae bacterium]